MKLKLAATELSDTDVEFVSMVKNGANRIPWKITKSGDNDAMLDLGSLFRKAQKSELDPKPAIIAVSMSKAASANQDAILKHAGIDPAKCEKTEEKGLITFTLKEEKDRHSDVTVVTLKGDVALAVTGLQKGFSGYDWESTDFGVVMGSGGYCSGISTASDMLDLTVANILVKASDPSEAGTMVAKAIDDFKDYVVKLTSGLPVQAFKAEIELAKMDAKNPLAKAGKGKWVDGKWVEDKGGEGEPGSADKGKDGAKKEEGALVFANKSEAVQACLALPDAKPGWMTQDQYDAMAAVKAEVLAKAEQPKPTEAQIARKAELPKEKPAFMTGEQWADFYKAETGEDWPQGDMTNGHGGGVDQGTEHSTSQQATQDDKSVPDNLGSTSSTELPEGALAVHKTALAAMKKAGSSEADIKAFVKAVTIDPTKDQSVAGAEMGDGKGFAAAGAPPKGTADEDYSKAIDTKARAALGMKKNDRKTGAKKAVTADPTEGKNRLEDGKSGAGAADATKKEEGNDAVLKALADFQKTISGEIASVKTDFSKLDARVGKVADQVAKTEAAINGTVHNEADDDDDTTRMVKSEQRAGVPPLLDTATDRRHLKAA